MKINESNIEEIEKLIDKIQAIFIEDKDIGTEKVEKLYEYISKEDLLRFLSALKQLKRKEILKLYGIISNSEGFKNNPHDDLQEKKYTDADVFNTFNNSEDDEISKLFKLNDLRSMYFSIFGEIPSNSKTKKDLISSLRGYIYSLNRANAFNG